MLQSLFAELWHCDCTLKEYSVPDVSEEAVHVVTHCDDKDVHPVTADPSSPEITSKF